MRSPFIYYFILAGLTLLVLLPFGVLGFLSPAILWPIFSIHSALLVAANKFALKESLDHIPQRYRAAMLCVIFATLAICISTALVPVTARDALIHHLAVPKWWLEQGRISSFQWYNVSYYPMLFQLAFIPLLSAFPPQACALYLILYLIPFCASAGMVANSLSRNTTPKGAFGLSFLSALTLPVVLRLCAEPLVDLPLGAYCGITVALLFNGNLLGGIALGLALSAKYNALPFALFLALVAPLARINLKFVAKFIALACIIYAPWWVRNLLETGNPFYPLGSESSGLSSVVTRTFLYGESVWELLFTPFAMLISGVDGDPRHFDGALSPILLLAAVGIWQFRRERSVVAISFLTFAYFVFSQLSSGARVRYLIPIIPELSALTGLGISSFAVPIISSLIFAQLAWISLYLTQRIENLGAIKFFTSSQSSRQYLAERLPEYEFSLQVAPLIPPDENVYLLLTGNRFFYLPFKARSAGYLSGEEVKNWLLNGDIIDELLKRDCKFLFVNSTLFEKLTDEGSKTGLTLLLAQKLERVAQSGDFSLFRVASNK